MANARELKDRIGGIQDTQKITNAMYLISSTKLRKAKQALDLTRPFYEELRKEIKRIFRTVDYIDSRYYFPMSGSQEIPGTYGYLVITADKGLAGAFNLNVVKEANRLMDLHDDNRLFVVGEFGRQYYQKRNAPMEEDFRYSAQNPTIDRAREIASRLMDLYNEGTLKKIFIIYTAYENGLVMDAVSTRLLPFHQALFGTDKDEAPVEEPFEFYPSIAEVLDHITPSYLEGFIYSAMVESFCCEQNARMTAMDSANTNAQNMLDELFLEYNHMRQAAITQEIIEVCTTGERS